MIKNIRRFTRAAFFIFAVSVFSAMVTDQRAVSFFNSFHVFPALSSLTSYVSVFFAGVTAAVVLSCVFAGRIYCSFLCPMGTLQDAAASAARKFFGLKPRRAKVYHNFRIFLAAFCLVSVFSESSAWGWLDHFSNFGRVVCDFFRPLLFIAASPFSSYLNRTASFQLPEGALHPGPEFYYAALVFTAVAVTSVFFPRWFCAALCPSGAIYSLLFKYGFLKINRYGECPGCLKCDNSCPVGCISAGRVDYDLCITCLECLNSCPFGLLRLEYSRPAATALPAPAPDAAASRRGFIVLMISAGAGAALPGLASKLAPPPPALPATIMPPGAISAERFFADCSACHMCVSACPTRAIVPSGLENGLAGLFKPRMDYVSGYCSYECNACMQVCPAGALRLHTLAQKQLIKIGAVTLDTSPSTSCIPYREKKDCGACAEHCPTGAVHMVRSGDIFVPELSWEYCIGCGICEHACPVRTGRRPIVVSPVAGQSMAKSPIRLSKPMTKKPGQNEFPF